MPSTPVALLIAVLFVIPGFITRTVLGANIVRRKQDATEWGSEILLYGGINTLGFLLVYAIVTYFRPVSASDFSAFPPQYGVVLVLIAAYVVFLVLTPIVLGVIIVHLLDRGLLMSLSRLLRVRIADSSGPTAWDDYFKKRQQCWVVVTFRDGSRVGGFMGTKSSAGTSQDNQDLYLEAAYNVGEDGALYADPVPQSGGIWIQGSEIKVLEFYVPPTAPAS